VPTAITIAYDINIQAAGKPIPPYARVHIYTNDAAGSTVWTKRYRSPYYSGRGKWLNRKVTLAPLTLGPNYDIRIELESQQGTGTPVGNVTMRLHGPDEDIPGISYAQSPAVHVLFDTTLKYPEGYYSRATVDGINFTYTHALNDTGAQVATGLAALIDAHANYVATASGGDITVTKVAGGFATITYSTDFSESTAMFDPTVTFTVNAQVGKTLRNGSDGSSGVITSNTEHVLKVTAFTGGADNKFTQNDLWSLDATAATFTFRKAAWNQREVGDDTTNPFPSFIGKAINEVFFYKGRLCFLCGEGVIMSVVEDVYNFWRQSAKDLFDDDPIDVRHAFGNHSTLHSAILWNEALYLVADNAQFKVTGSPLTPATVALDLVLRFENTPRIRPLVMGNSIIACKADEHATRVWQYFWSGSELVHDGVELTDGLPQYLKGKPLAMVGSAVDGFLAVLTDEEPNVLYVYSYKDTLDGNRVMSSWSRWTWAEAFRIRGLGMIASNLYLVSTHVAPGGGV
jgi:hypothetical protein